MRSTKIIRAAKTGYIILSAIFCGLGILLMADPRMSVALIGDIVGIVLVAFGIIKLVGYFSKDLYRLAFQFDLAFGILLIAMGLVLLIKPESAMNILCIILGIEIIADGLFKVQTSLDARRFGLNTWWLILSLAIIAGAIGAVLIFYPSESVRALTWVLGLSLLVEGVLNLCVALCAIKIIEHQRPDTIEAEIY
ncbi:MAG: DUF308 domain-containing protein [Clostridia bacterium]|nr:DUF308 domain-containing protein [Clostridia bacterium]